MFMHFKFLLLSFDSNRSIARLSTKSGWPAWPTAPWPVVWGWIGEATCPVRPYPFGRPSPIVVESQSSTQEHRWRRYVFPYFFFTKSGIFSPFWLLLWPLYFWRFLAIWVTITNNTLFSNSHNQAHRWFVLTPDFFSLHSLITSAHYWYHHEADLFFLTFICFDTRSRVTLWWKTKDLIFNHISYIYLCHFPVWCRKLSLEICHLWHKVEFFADSLLGYSTIKSNNFSLLNLFFVTIYNKMLPSQFTRKSTVRNSTLITRECVVIYGF